MLLQELSCEQLEWNKFASRSFALLMDGHFYKDGGFPLTSISRGPQGFLLGQFYQWFVLMMPLVQEGAVARQN